MNLETRVLEGHDTFHDSRQANIANPKAPAGDSNSSLHTVDKHKTNAGRTVQHKAQKQTLPLDHNANPKQPKPNKSNEFPPLPQKPYTPNENALKVTTLV